MKLTKEWKTSYPAGKEKDLKKDLREYLTSIGAHWKMSVPVGFGKNGVDFDVCFLGLYIAIETKVGNNKATPQQKDYLFEVAKAGGSAVVAYSVHHVIDAIIDIKDGATFVSEEIKTWAHDKYGESL